MTVYFWYSATMTQDCASKRAEAFNSAAKKTELGYSYHMTEEGRVVCASFVTERSWHEEDCADAKQVGRADRNICLIDRLGNILNAGRQFCTQRNMVPETASIKMLCENNPKI